MTAAPIRIANCSGFYGDRLAAAREMVEGGPIDVLTGDWLAELTMLVLAKNLARDHGAGYARTFVTQMEQVMGQCLDRGIKVVSNAGDRPGWPNCARPALAERLAGVHVGETLAGRAQLGQPGQQVVPLDGRDDRVQAELGRNAGDRLGTAIRGQPAGVRHHPDPPVQALPQTCSIWVTNVRA